MNTSWFTIINPCSGSGKVKVDWPRIEALLQKTGIEYHPRFTEYRNHATELTMDAIGKGWRRILVIGGDGTANEVVNGIFNQTGIPTTDITLAMIPVGTGNDWRRTVGIPKSYPEAVTTVKTGETYLQDVGFVKYQDGNGQEKGRYFINIAGMGYDAMVATRTNLLKELGRKVSVYAYLINVFSCLLKYKHTKVKVTADHEEITTDLLSMNVGICKYSGGGMMQAPKAIPDDGLLDLTLIKKMTKFQIIKNVGKLYDGSFIHLPWVHITRSQKVVVESEPEITLEADGEILGSSPFEIDIIPRSVKIVINQGYFKGGVQAVTSV
jgi:YegS/Rv2252/BmrU family lipid kinase